VRINQGNGILMATIVMDYITAAGGVEETVEGRITTVGQN
jgi:hypothetical protein